MDAAFRSLKPGGKFVGIDENPNFQIAPHLQPYGITLQKPRPLHVTYDNISFIKYWFTNEEWSEVFKKAGFSSLLFVNFEC